MNTPTGIRSGELTHTWKNSGIRETFTVLLSDMDVGSEMPLPLLRRGLGGGLT